VIGAIDIGGTKVAIGIVTEAGKVFRACELPAPPLCDAGQAGFAEVQNALADLARSGPIDGIGVACTGPVDPRTGIIGDVATIRGWNGLNLIKALEARFGVPVAVENDADACALAEWAWGGGRGKQRMFYVTVSTGIGAGAVFDGELYRGAGGFHPEFGHHIIDRSGPECYCGAHGCWESFASGPAMAEWYLSQSGNDEAGVDARQICELAAAGDDLAGRAVERESRYLAFGLANLITMFVPDIIVLGGGVMRSWGLFEPGVRATLSRTCQIVPWERSEIVPSELGSALPLLGAARVWLNHHV
jgi:glucokinase